MANDDLDSFLRKASNYHGGAPEYYEDTHDEFGNYRGGARSMAQSDQAVGSAASDYTAAIAVRCAATACSGHGGIAHRARNRQSDQVSILRRSRTRKIGKTRAAA